MPRKGHISKGFKKPGAFGKQEGRKPLSQIKEEVDRKREELRRRQQGINHRLDQLMANANTRRRFGRSEMQEWNRIIDEFTPSWVRQTLLPSEQQEWNRLIKESDEIKYALSKYQEPEERIKTIEERAQQKAERLGLVIQRINKIKMDLRHAQRIKAFLGKPEKAKLESELANLESERKRLQEAMIRKAGE